MLAAERGHADIARELLMRDYVNVNAVSRPEGLTALAFAAREGHLSVVQELLEQDHLDVNKADARGQTPLILGKIARMLPNELFQIIPTTYFCYNYKLFLVKRQACGYHLLPSCFPILPNFYLPWQNWGD